MTKQIIGKLSTGSIGNALIKTLSQRNSRAGILAFALSFAFASAFA